jgi:hypothetical protein
MKAISGPINIIRLEGNINNITKILYLFMDIHQSVDRQTECQDIRSINTTNFIIDKLDEYKKEYPDKMFDVFIERDPLIPNFVDKNYKGRYFDEMIHLFNRGYHNNVVSNCRFHYMDIRSYFVTKLKELADQFNDTANNMWKLQRFSIKKIINLKDCLTILKTLIMKIYDIIYLENKSNYKTKNKLIYSQHENILSKYTEEEYIETTKNLFNKLFDKYENNTIKEQIIKILNSELEQEFKIVFNIFDTDIKYFNEILNKYDKNNNVDDIFNSTTVHSYGISLSNNLEILLKIKIIGSKLYDIIYGNFGAMITDVYFVRRFLDKLYITNTLLYTGGNHTINIIRLLVKYFNFKITNCSYFGNNNNNDNNNDNNDNNIDDKIYDIINKSKHCNEIKQYFYPQHFLQCSIYNQKFPKLFL